MLAHDEPNPTNLTAPRALDGIYMRPLSNAHGGHKILNLETKQIIVHRNISVVPITPDVVKAVEALAKRDRLLRSKLSRSMVSDAATAGLANDDQSDSREAVEQNDYYNEDQGPVVDQVDEAGAIVNQPEDNGNDESGEDALAGPAQPAVRRSGCTPAPCQLPNIADTRGQTYGTAMNQGNDGVHRQ
jgi:hypothetical protein